MAITTPTMTGAEPIERDDNRWAVNFIEDFTLYALNEELKAAPARDGSALYITHVTMGVRSNVAFAGLHCPDAKLTLVDGAGINIFGPIHFQEKGQTNMSKDFEFPMKLTDKKALDIVGAGLGSGYYPSCFVYVEGFTGDKPYG